MADASVTHVENEQEETTKVIVWSDVDFLQPDTETNTFYDGQDLKAATLPKLISALTASKTPDPALISDFLLTYRSYLSEFDFMDALIARYKFATKEQDEKSIRLRVFNVIKHWLEKYWEDFKLGGQELSDKLSQFLEDVLSSNDEKNKKVALSVKDRLTKQLAGESKKISKVDAEALRPLLPREPTENILDYPPEEIARQLTLIDWNMWSAIQPWECLGLAWTKKNKEKRSPHVLQMSDWFNYLSGWVASSICTCEKLKDRVKIMTKWIDIANRLKMMGNFNGLMAIISGINRGPVYRMKATQDLLTKDVKFFKILTDLRELVDRDKNNANLRSALKTANPPIIPYLGMFLTDLTFIEEGNTNYLPPHNLVNFYKCRSIAKTIQKIQQYQYKGYVFTEVPTMQTKIKAEKILSEDELYELSNWLEPRPGAEKGEKPAALGGTRKHTDLIPPPPKIDLEYKKEWQMFYIKDTANNVVIDREGVVSLATLSKLVEKLTNPVITPDRELVVPLLYSSRTFCTAEELLNLLIIRFQVPDPKDKSEESMQKWVTEFQIPIHLRVFNVIKSWIMTQPHDFHMYPILKTILTEFYEGIMLKLSPTTAKSLATLVKSLDKPSTPSDPDHETTTTITTTKEKSEESGKPDESDTDTTTTATTTTTHSGDAAASRDVDAKVSSCLDFDAVEVARDLYLKGFKLFSMILPFEWLTHKFCISERQHAVNLRNYYAFGDGIRSWTESEIELADKQGNTHIALIHLINIAKHSQSVGHWMAIRGIIKGLEFTLDKQHLLDAWNKVSLNDRAFFFEMKDLLDIKNQAKLIAKMKELKSPAIPLPDLMFDNIDKLSSYGDDYINQMINVSKKKALGDVMMNFIKYQKVSTSKTKSNPTIAQYIERIEIKSNYDVYEDIERYNPTQSNSVSNTRSSSPRGSNSGGHGISVESSQLEFFLLDLVMNDDDFKHELESRIKLTMSDEMNKFQAEIKELINGGHRRNRAKSSVLTQIEDQKAKAVLDKEFPNCPISSWTQYDALGVVSGIPEDITINILEKDSTHFILQIKEHLGYEDVTRVLEIGKLYRSHHPSIILSCIILAHEVTPQSEVLCNKSHIKILRV
eukprot:TRINITY_DN6479_c0_g1_i1.p1 TRINITY_DN6479_c0_g1~~TRINITY_DN6479_c0_g1_i1.p1  ORF type:complete len:1105 (+),score=214.78 TRINITY_DN6479_c0_g1_i1:1899-5213(+)